MCRALRRAAGCLLLAGAFGLTAPAGAQTARPTAGQAHLERMKVELAWLADPACFRQRLEAVVAGGSLEVRGDVTSQEAREHALRVARQSCFLPVIDALSVHGGGPVPGRGPDQVRLAAVSLLTAHLGARAQGFDVSVGENGSVRVGGAVASVEDKLTVSRCLRELPGCSCVHNRVSVTPASHAGQTVTLVSSDGRYMVAGALGPVAAPAEPYQAPQRAAPQAARPGRLSPVPARQDSVHAASGWYPGPTNLASPGRIPGETGYAAAPQRPPAAPQATARQASLQPASWPPAHAVGTQSATPAQAPVQGARYAPESNERIAPMIQASTAPPSPTQVQRAVRRACGRLATRVDVQLQRDRSMVVHVQCPSPAAEQQVLVRMLTLPEVAHPAVRVEVASGR